MPISESVNADGRTVLVLDDDEAAVVCGPDGIQLYLHQGPEGPVESEQNKAATAMALMYGDFEYEAPFGGTDGTENN